MACGCSVSRPSLKPPAHNTPPHLPRKERKAIISDQEVKTCSLAFSPRHLPPSLLSLTSLDVTLTLVRGKITLVTQLPESWGTRDVTGPKGGECQKSSPPVESIGKFIKKIFAVLAIVKSPLKREFEFMVNRRKGLRPM